MARPHEITEETRGTMTLRRHQGSIRDVVVRDATFVRVKNNSGNSMHVYIIMADGRELSLWVTPKHRDGRTKLTITKNFENEPENVSG